MRASKWNLKTNSWRNQSRLKHCSTEFLSARSLIRKRKQSFLHACQTKALALNVAVKRMSTEQSHSSKADPFLFGKCVTHSSRNFISKSLSRLISTRKPFLFYKRSSLLIETTLPLNKALKSGDPRSKSDCQALEANCFKTTDGNTLHRLKPSTLWTSCSFSKATKSSGQT